jgi:hypothetical protein
MFENLMTSFLPSPAILAVSGATVILVIGAVLLQRAARTHMHQQRCDELRQRVSRVDARWHEAAM